eukprot:1178695-Prorocentrum_minimum.AAC.2
MPWLIDLLPDTASHPHFGSNWRPIRPNFSGETLPTSSNRPRQTCTGGWKPRAYLHSTRRSSGAVRWEAPPRSFPEATFPVTARSKNNILAS